MSATSYVAAASVAACASLVSSNGVSGNGLRAQDPHLDTIDRQQIPGRNPTRIAAERNVPRNNTSGSLGSKFMGGKVSRKSDGVARSLLMGRTDRPRVLVTSAALAVDAPMQMSEEYTLEGGSLLQVSRGSEPDGSRAYLHFTISRGSLVNCPLVLHWGATRAGKSGWVLPDVRPSATRNYKDRALQSPFQKNGDTVVLRIEVSDRSINAIEFTVKNEASNDWFKFNGGNFRADLSWATGGKPDVSNISIPEDLVQVQAYLRWERNGKQSYSQEQEAAEYEQARLDLQREVQAGVTVKELRKRLKGEDSSDTNGSGASSGNGNAAVSSNGNGNGNGNGPAKTNGSAGDVAVKIPDDMVQVQAYIRWEKSGKPNNSPEKQQEEMIEARKDLERRVSSGATISQLWTELTGGPRPPTKAGSPRSSIRVQRKIWDANELIVRVDKKQGGETPRAAAPREQELTPLELGAQVMAGVDNGSILSRKMYKVGDGQLLVLVTNAMGEVKVRLASSLQSPLRVHWGLTKGKRSGWQTPPEELVPACSVAPSGGACETPFTPGFAGEPSLQSLTMNLGENACGYDGISFVLKDENGQWYKDQGSDFHAALQKVSLKIPKEKMTGINAGFLDSIADAESDAERSLMHRYNLGASFVERVREEGELALAGVLVWLRYMATRQLTWNKNYNVKPREISQAQDRLTDNLKDLFLNPQFRELARMTLGTVGRGGEGNVGQRIRDEILVIQQNNDVKGAMVEEWHQKLHNNTSPDDVVICQALIDYIASDFDISVYWDTLNREGVTKERMAGYDRPIVSEPRFRQEQKEGLTRDLKAYLKTLKAVHSGADLESAVATCMGYKLEACQGGSGKEVEIHPIAGLSGALPNLLRFVVDHVEDRAVIPLLEGLLEARRELRPSLYQQNNRLKDIIFLDLALDSTVRTAVERGMDQLRNAGAADIIYMVTLVVENLCLSLDNNEELVYCLKDWYGVMDACRGNADNWALRAKAVMDRTRLLLAEKGEQMNKLLQPSAEYLGARLGVAQWAVDIFTEELIRAGSAAPLSLLLNRLNPVLRAAADMGSWQIISPFEVRGFVEVVHDLGSVQEKLYSRPTILVADRVKGEEEIPDGVVALLTPDMPDVLSHVSVRARNCKVCFATCFDEAVLGELRALEEKAVLIKPTSSDIQFSRINEGEVGGDSASGTGEMDPPPGISLTRHTFAGKYAVTADEFTPALVGAKSRNIAGLRGLLPSWVKLPTSVALPFGSFEKVLSEDMNRGLAEEIEGLKKDLKAGDVTRLADIRKAVLGLQPPPSLVNELKDAMKKSNMPWPGDEGEQRWEQAWQAIKKVWASKWNERAYISTRKARIDHADLVMAVLVQEIVQADYAFVIHTTNPSNDDASEIYAEVVKGLGETLVGAYSGRALSFVAKKDNIKSPKVLGYPSKRVGLFIKRSVIFRSDSNGEDLEGYAGAGLYDSVPIDEEEELVVDYSTDKLVVDAGWRTNILTKIAEAGAEIEKTLGSPQDIEGVIKDGELYVVQTRPQM